VLYRVLHVGPDLRGCPGSLLGLIGACLTRDPAARPAPAQVIGQCRAQIPAARFEFTASWLPPALAATLAPPPSPVPPPSTTTAPPTLQPSREFFLSAAQPPPAVPSFASPTVRPTLVAPDGPPPRPRRLSRGVLVGAVAVGVAVAALAGYGLVTLVGRGHDDAGSPPGSSAASDRCLIGTWTFTSVTLPDEASGQDITFTGDGPTVTFLADGVQNIDYGAGTGLTAQFDGGTITLAFAGSATARYSTRNGTLLLRGISEHGNATITSSASGVAGPSETEPLPQSSGASNSLPYTCSADTLQMSPLYKGQSAPEVLTRDTPQG
jgi:hypothetical protein